jgi:ADP-ribosyl-[dinitrogen reductase] hydrolase
MTDRIRGGLMGLLVGDALGVPYEFTQPYEIPPFDQIEMEPPVGFHRAHDVLAGTWSDDGSQALCLLASLQENGALDTQDLAQRFLRWASQGYMAVDGLVFDIGTQTNRAFIRLKQGIDPEQAGGSDEMDNGNGSLMRTLPLALWHQGPDADLVRDAMRQSSLTHNHDRSKVACALYCMWARVILEGEQDIEAALHTSALRTRPHLVDVIQQHELYLILNHQISGFGRGSGYVLDSFASAREALKEPSYEQVVKKAISFGRDTDTTTAIAGGIAGLIYGESGIPTRWLHQLRGQDLLSPLLHALEESQS